MATPSNEEILRLVGIKIAELLVSFKVHLCTIATALLITGYIGSTEWVTVVTSIGLGRVLIESIVATKGNNEKI